MKFKRFITILLTLTILSSMAVSVRVNAAQKTKAIVIIPGIMGSKLYNSGTKIWPSAFKLDQLKCNENGISIYPNITVDNTDTDGAGATCRLLYQSLSAEFGGHYDVFLFSYDWRKSCAAAAQKLQTRLSNYTNVVIVAHSMGGLVASKYLALSSSNQNKVSKLITLGTPYNGSVKALNVFETGAATGFLNNDSWITTVIKNKIKEIVCNLPGLYELLPTSRHFLKEAGYIRNNSSLINTHSASYSFMKNRSWGKKQDGSTKQMFNQAISFHNSLLTNNIHIANNTSIVECYKIYGYGKNTPTCVNYDSNGDIYLSFNNDGDGTVISSSAICSQSKTANRIYGYNVNHVGLALNAEVIGQVKAIIKGQITAKSGESELLKTNEAGWITGRDNRRIVILTYNLNDLIIITKEGNKVFQKGDDLYSKNNNQEIEIGTIWMLNDNSTQIVLNDEDYSFLVDECSPNSKMKILYMDNGLYLKGIVVDQLKSNDMIKVQKSNSKQVSMCSDEKGSIKYHEFDINKLNNPN